MVLELAVLEVKEPVVDEMKLGSLGRVGDGDVATVDYLSDPGFYWGGKKPSCSTSSLLRVPQMM